MKELSDYEFAPTSALLNWAFRVCRESTNSVDLSARAPGRATGQDLKMLGVAQAARVVNFVDSKLPAVQKALVRFCFARVSDSDSDQNQNYNALHNWVWKALALADVSREVENNLSVLRVLVPYEVRLRVYGMKRGYSMQMLADFLDEPKTTFQRDCKAVWYAMVDLLWDQRTAAFSAVDDFLAESLRKRLEGQQAVANKKTQTPDMLLVAEIAKYFQDTLAQNSGVVKARSAGAVKFWFTDERQVNNC